MKPLSQSEFNLTVLAKNGDASANLELWERYKPVAISLLKPVRGWSFEDKMSEAYMVFIHKLEIFNPDKVLAVRDPDSFTFSYMVIGGLKNLKIKLIAKYKAHISHVSFVPLDEIGSRGLDKEYPFIAIDKGRFYMATSRIDTTLFNSNNPASILAQSTTNELKKKKQLLYSSLSSFQKQIIEMKREGKPLKEISKILGCSYTKLKDQYADAKHIAIEIFDLKFAK
jgi:hypothetical protein